MDELSGQPMSAAQRRRQRRLRSMLRHEQQSIRMALATVMHHSYKVHTENGAPRGQTTATRAGGEGTEFYAMSEGSDVVVGGRPPSLVDVRPQERLQQRTVKQIVDPVPVVPLLHDVEPQLGVQLVDFLAPLDVRVAEQVIEVPQIVCPPRGARTVLGAPLLADQLVEVPTVLTLSSSWRPLFTEEDIQRMIAGLERGGGGARQGSRSGQESTPSWFRVVDNPVPQVRREGGGGVQGSLPARRAPD